MTNEEIRAELARYSFIPGSWFELVDGPGYEENKFVYIELLASVPSSRPPHQGVTVRRTRCEPRAHVTPEHLQYILSDMVFGFHEHETKEWFRRDGKWVVPPH